MVELCARKNGTDSYISSAAVRVSNSSRNHLASAEAAFNFVHLLSHLTANVGGVCFQAAHVSPSEAQCHFNPAIHEILHEWCSLLLRNALTGHDRIYSCSCTHVRMSDRDHIPKIGELQSIAKLRHFRQLSITTRKEDIAAMLQLAVLGQDTDMHSSVLPNYSSILAALYNSRRQFTAADLCGVVKVRE